MFKLIILVLGLAIGFGGGVYWAQKNPDAATKLAQQEEKQVIEKALAMNQQIKAKLEQIQAAKSGKTPGSGFLGSSSSAAPDVSDVKAEAQKQEDELNARLAKLKQRAMGEDSGNLRSRIRAVLLSDWDPSNAAHVDAAQQTYDAYLAPLANLIQAGCSEQALIDFLKERESEIMCFPAIGASHLKRVARKLAALRDPIQN